MASSSIKQDQEFFLETNIDSPQMKIGIGLTDKSPNSTASNLVYSPISSSSDSYCSDDGEEPYDIEDTEEDELLSSTNRSLDILCMSPPGVRIIKNPKTSTKHGKPKKSRLKKNRPLKRPSLINSAAVLENKDETSLLVDSLTELQEQHNNPVDVLSTAIADNTLSAPVETNNINIFSSQLQESANKRAPADSNNNESTPLVKPVETFDRADNYKKISLLLKLALSVHNKNKHHQEVYNIRLPTSVPPPPTPASSLICSPLSSLLQSQPSSSSTGSSSYPGILTSSNFLTCKINQSELDNARQLQADNVWKHIYDFFEHYDNRSDDNDVIDRRLSETRAAIPKMITDIMSTNFSGITSYMNQDIDQKLKSPLQYSSLYESKVYIDQLCYLYWLVEDVINRIGYIESLYPSLRQLKLNQPSYEDKNFDGQTKTLMLWYKIMTELMSKSDILGKFLGFAKRPENLQYWTWFDQRLNYSHMEYNNVQTWLNDNFTKSENNNTTNTAEESSNLSSHSNTIQNSTKLNTTSTSQNNNINKSSVSKSLSKNSTIDDLIAFASRNSHVPKQNRQVSFELHASCSITDLLYNNLDSMSQSVIEAGDFNYQQTTEPTDDDEKLSDKNSHFMSNLSVNSINNTSQMIGNNNEVISSLLTTASDFQVTFLSNQEDHLKQAKLHHLNSFVSRSSRTSNESSELSSSFYSNLHSSMLNKPKSEGLLKEVESVGFELNQPDNDDGPSRYESARNSPTSGVETKFETANEGSDSSESRCEENQIESQSENKTQENKFYSDSKIQRQKIFREFLHKRLRKHGLTKTCDEITKILMSTLPHVLTALQIDHCERPMENSEYINFHLMPLHRTCREYMAKFPCDVETMTYGVRSQWFKNLDLPTFRPLYLYLASVILELMHMCIKMQIDNKRDMKKQINFRRARFSLLSIEVLTHECRECIEQAILVRQFYYHMVYSVFERQEINVQTEIENDLISFDDDLKEIIDIYLSLVTDWVHDLVAVADTTKALYVLKDEWNFCKNNLYFVTASEDIYAKRFCTMCSSVNESIVHILNDIDCKHKQPLMEYVEHKEMLIDMNSFEEEEDNEESYSEFDEYNSMEQRPAILHEQLNLHDSGPDDQSSANLVTDQNTAEYRRKQLKSRHEARLSYEVNSFDVNLKCNEFKEAINHVRKRCMKALSFCGSLVNDLELAAKYNITSKIQLLLDDLRASNHVLVMFTNPELQSCYRTTPNSSASSFEPVHYQNEFPASDTNDSENKPTHSFMIFVPQEFAKDKTHIARLLFIISAKDDYDNFFPDPKTESDFSNPLNRRLSSSNAFYDINANLAKLSKMASMGTNYSTSKSNTPNSADSSSYFFSPHISSDAYLLYLQLPKTKAEYWEWNGKIVKLYASMPVRRSLYQHKNCSDPQVPVSLILVVSSPQNLKEKRNDLKKKLKGRIQLTREKTSFHPNIEYAIDDLKDSILYLRKESADWIKSIEKDLKNTLHNENDNKYHTNTVIDQRYLSEIWRVSYNFGIELQSECIQFMTQDRAEQFSVGLADFCVKWCEYIVDKTERGKGRTVRPWAAKKGIQLMEVACKHSDNINDTEFFRLIRAVEKCILHVIGGRSCTSQCQSVDIQPPELKTSNSVNNNIANTCHDLGMAHLRSSESQLYDEPVQRHHHFASTRSQNPMNNVLPPSERFNQKCNLTDKRRENELLEKRYIGKILDQQRTQHVITATEVNFRWQLGLLIGEGMYGTVYSCVNLDTGEPMAMKEIPFKSNDVKTISSIADEINNLQGINHENLVRFYGAELHRKEILIFMEFCGDQCTLDRISRETSGLPEKIVRNYTKSLLKAVETLHENKIMHRDIKGANIFLKAIDPNHPEKIVLKLGDFGCSIKFKDMIGSSRNNQPKATGFMGTFPFMAPEVMVCGGAVECGYTYSADIWSLGCVVIEMFMGKRPWHPLSDETILLKVHIYQTQKKPFYPATNISSEAIDFLDKCLEFEPNLRHTADQLLDHPFVMVCNNDQYSSL